MKRLLIGIVSVVALAAFAGSASAQDAKAEKGAKLFAATGCAMCHSVDGKGNPKGALDSVGAKLKPEEIREWLSDPAAAATKAKAERKPPMTAISAKLKALSKDDVDALVAYLSSLKKK
jgi:cytochrome c553